MDFYGAKHKGKLYVQIEQQLGQYQADDEGRLIYSKTTGRIYLGTGVGWKDITGAGDSLADADMVDGLHASTIARPNTLLALDVNMQLPTSADMVDWHHVSLAPSASCIPVYDSNGQLPGSVDKVDGLHAASFVRTDAASTVDGFTTTFKGSAGAMNATTGSKGSMIISPISDADPAMIAFSRSSFNTFFGLDTDNKFKHGGWSAGANKYQFWTESNMGHLSGMNADSVDTFHASATPTPGFLLPLDSNALLPKAAIPSGVGMPVGSIVAFPVPIGSGLYADYISSRGQWLLKTNYPDLWNAIGGYYGDGDDATHQSALGIGTTKVGYFRIPDYRGYFLRMIDGGSGNDPHASTRVAAITGVTANNGLGSVQLDHVINHTHLTDFMAHPYASQYNSSWGCAWTWDRPDQNALNWGVSNCSWPSATAAPALYTFDYGTNMPAGTLETAPKNVYVEFGIKWR